VIRESNPAFRIDQDLGVRRIAPKMYWIHSPVDVNHLAEFCENRPVTAREMLINLLNCPILQLNAEESDKVIRNPPRDRITTNSQSTLPTGRSNHNIKFQSNWLITFGVILVTDTQTHKQTGPTTQPHPLRWQR